MDADGPPAPSLSHMRPSQDLTRGGTPQWYMPKVVNEEKNKGNKSQASLPLPRNIWLILSVGWIFQSHYIASLPS